MGKSVIQQALRPFMNKQIIVVTSDTGAYLGTLSDFDAHHLVLTDAYESSTATALTWHKVILESPMMLDANADLDMEGVDKRKIVLKRVIISMNQIIRIWPIEDGIE